MSPAIPLWRVPNVPWEIQTSVGDLPHVQLMAGGRFRNVPLGTAFSLQRQVAVPEGDQDSVADSECLSVFGGRPEACSEVDSVSFEPLVLPLVLPASSILPLTH